MGEAAGIGGAKEEETSGTITDPTESTSILQGVYELRKSVNRLIDFGQSDREGECWLSFATLLGCKPREGRERETRSCSKKATFVEI